MRRVTFTIIAAVLSGCAGLSDGDGKPAALRISSVSMESAGAKSVITDTSFSKGCSLGLFLTDSDGGTDKYDADNTMYTLGEDGWYAASPIMLSPAKGKLYGYYPYDAAKTTLTAIPVESSLDSLDYMYATPVDSLCKAKADANITMYHALARISVLVRKTAYIGPALLSRIEFKGADIAQSGTLDITDGGLAAAKGDVAFDVPSGKRQLTEDGTTYEFLIVPSKEDLTEQDVELVLTIDGEDNSVLLSEGNGVVFAKGVRSSIILNLDRSGIIVASTESYTGEEYNPWK